MRATAWHNGADPEEPAGYGLKFTIADRDRYFDRTWDRVVVELDDAEPTEIDLSPSFWRSCSELRSADVGRWLLKQGAAPWPKQSPPGVVVTPIDGNRFSARVLRLRRLPGR